MQGADASASVAGSSLRPLRVVAQFQDSQQVLELAGTAGASRYRSKRLQLVVLCVFTFLFRTRHHLPSSSRRPRVSCTASRSHAQSFHSGAGQRQPRLTIFVPFASLYQQQSQPHVRMFLLCRMTKVEASAHTLQAVYTATAAGATTLQLACALVRKRTPVHVQPHSYAQISETASGTYTWTILAGCASEGTRHNQPLSPTSPESAVFVIALSHTPSLIFQGVHAIGFHR